MSYEVFSMCELRPQDRLHPDAVCDAQKQRQKNLSSEDRYTMNCDHETYTDRCKSCFIRYLMNFVRVGDD
jgi:hypothetical protein